jgi:hypothetical protein
VILEKTDSATELGMSECPSTKLWKHGKGAIFIHLSKERRSIQGDDDLRYRLTDDITLAQKRID